MGLRINTNVASVNAQRNLSVQQKDLDHAQAAISSGKRIVTSADDAAGHAISENIRAQIAGVNKAKDNAFNAQSMFQIGEGAMNEVNNILVRVRELGIQSASDNVSDTERALIDTEVQALLEESDRIAKSTRFGNLSILDGGMEEMEFHVGPYGGEENIIRMEVSSDATNEGLNTDSISLADKSGAKDSLETVDNALEKLASMRANFGASQSRLQRTVSNLENQNVNLQAAKSRISDADIAEESSKMASANILQQAGVSILAQANQNGAAALRLIG